MKQKNEYKEGINWYGWVTPFSGYGIVIIEYSVSLN